jgi:hypothetical protein
MLLKSELLGVEPPSPRTDRADDRAAAGGGGGAGGGAGSASSPSRNIFRFMAPRQTRPDDSSYSLSPVGSASQRLLASPRKAKRKIPKVPFKVLDAPALQDDFYLNLVDWSSLNVLAVGLGSCVYLWSACTSKVTKLCDLGPEDCITSVSWTQRGTHLAVGTNAGEVQIWEAQTCKKIRVMAEHTARVGTMAWNAHTLASGSRDRHIFQRDVRVGQSVVRKLSGHKQEVCGLRWSFDDQQLASGGNDNKLFIWNAHSSSPLTRFNEHTAAVKAIAWSPHQHGEKRSSAEPRGARACSRHSHAQLTHPRCPCSRVRRFVGVGRWHGRSVHPVLEHAHIDAAQLRGHGLAGVQSHVVQERQRGGQHARLLAEPDHCVALPVHDEGRHPDGAHVQGAVPRHVAGRADDCDGRRRRDAAILECIPRAEE